MSVRLLIIIVIGFVLSGLSASAQTTDKSIVPKPFFDFWNSADKVRTNNNCYNYASNRETDSYAQPGQASGQMYKNLTCPDVALAASKDLGYEATSFFPFAGKQDDLLVALVVWYGGDYHWYRRGDDNMWTHKMGSTAATNLDNSGKVITNPETADRGRYTQFCGYFRIKNFLKQTTNEQNGGYVRIGNMPNLPPTMDFAFTPPSSIQALVYSGRPDPVIPLKDAALYLKMPELLDLAHSMKTGQPFGTRIASMPPSLLKLGYRGLLIQDHEGLLFPRGTTVQIRGDYIFLTHANSNEIRWAKLSGLAQAEQRIVAEIKSRYP